MPFSIFTIFYPIVPNRVRISNPSLLIHSLADKARLLSLYIISKDNGLLEDDRRKLFEHARLDSQLREAINNLSLLDVKISKPPRKPGEKSTKKKREKKKRGEDDEIPYELSRYVPVIKKVMEVGRWRSNWCCGVEIFSIG